MRRVHLWAALTLAAGLVASPTAVQASGPSLAHEVGSDGSGLAGATHGEAAVLALGDRLPQVARRNGVPADQLRRVLRRDPTAWLDAHGRIFYVESAGSAADQAAVGQAVVAQAAPYPLADTFTLNSLPGAQRTIYLDFDGSNVSGTVWNTDFGLPSGDFSGWSADADYATFTDAERTTIQSVWQRVAEDYAPFNVNVTTQDPGAAAIDRASSTDQVFGTRALISGSSTAWQALCGQGCGGIAFLGVFDISGSSHAAYQPAWIFSGGTGDDAKGIAEAVAHEVGHNFGLDHDGTASSGYYTGANGWAPIMGAGYYQPITQWNNGSYAGANNTQDDVAIIAAGGAPLRADEAGSTPAAAAANPPTGTAYITGRADVDVFALPCSGATTITATPAPTSPNLDLEVKLLDAAGATMATANPVSARVDGDTASGLDATASVSGAASYVRIDGVGGDTRYTDYGSLGAYTLALSCPQARATAPTGLAVVVSADQLSASATWGAPASAGDTPITAYQVTVSGSAPVQLPADARSFDISGLQRGLDYTVSVVAINGAGAGLAATRSVHTNDVPGAPTLLAATPNTDGTIAVTWGAPTTSGGSAITGYQVWDPVGQTWVGVAAATTSYDVQGALPATSYTVSVRALNAIGTGPQTDVSVTTPTPPPPTVPGAPTIGRASAGLAGGAITAKARWYAATLDGGSAITGYLVHAVRITSTGRRVDGRTSTLRPATARSFVYALPRTGGWQFRVRAVNAVGKGAWSGWSNTTQAR